MGNVKISHLAIIPDGNRRWAKEMGYSLKKGYEISGNYERLKQLYLKCQEFGIKTFSFWALSTDNLEKRDSNEKEIVFKIVSRGLDEIKKDSEENKLKFIHIGRKDRLPKYIIDKIKELELLTINNKGMNLVLGMDYGGRDEIVTAVNKAVEVGKKVDEKEFGRLLYTKELPDPDLVIRTGGEKRLSGFMPFQTTYSEIIFMDEYFPRLTPEMIKEAIMDFSKKERRFGK